jgi:hypothetical protein
MDLAFNVGASMPREPKEGMAALEPEGSDNR